MRLHPWGARWWILVGIVGLLAGCIQPVETEPTPGPNDVPVQPPGADAAVPAAPAGDSASLIPVIDTAARPAGARVPDVAIRQREAGLPIVVLLRDDAVETDVAAGELREAGTHGELLERGGIYAKLWTLRPGT